MAERDSRLTSGMGDVLPLCGVDRACGDNEVSVGPRGGRATWCGNNKRLLFFVGRDEEPLSLFLDTLLFSSSLRSLLSLSVRTHWSRAAH